MLALFGESGCRHEAGGDLSGRTADNDGQDRGGLRGRWSKKVGQGEPVPLYRAVPLRETDCAPA